MRCIAKTKRSGGRKRCKGQAVTGSDKCRMHGAGGGRARANTDRRAREDAARLACERLGVPVEVDPAEALLRQVWEASGCVCFYRARLETDPEIRGLYDAERDRLTRACALALRAGVEERRVGLEEEKGRQIATLLNAVFEDAELGLSVAQRRAARITAARHLRALPGGG